MDYDDYEREMQEAGWSLDDIEAMWQQFMLDAEVDADETAHLNSLGPIDA